MHETIYIVINLAMKMGTIYIYIYIGNQLRRVLPIRMDAQPPAMKMKRTPEDPAGVRAPEQRAGHNTLKAH